MFYHSHKHTNSLHTIECTVKNGVSSVFRIRGEYVSSSSVRFLDISAYRMYTMKDESA